MEKEINDLKFVVRDKEGKEYEVEVIELMAHFFADIQEKLSKLY